MALSVTINGTTTAGGAVTPLSSGILALNPVSKSTTFILSASTLSTTAGAAYVEFTLDDPTIAGVTPTWALLSSATTLLASVIQLAPYSWTILSPVGAARINSTGGSTGGVSTYTLKALQSVTA
jgi:hypothetical protein